MDYLEIKEIFDSVYNQGIDIERLISLLKEKGVSQAETTMLLCKEMGIKFFDADRIVLYSKAWKDVKEINIQARNEFIDYLENS